jgi:GH15 family glucan-1,4-alpha-glucosidase
MVKKGDVLFNKSVNVLKSLLLKNGGITATPKEGGYPFVYTRDGVIISKALNRAGMVEESERFYYFMKKFTKIEDYGEVFQRYNLNGLPSVTRKNQNDNEGLLLHGIYDTYQFNKDKSFLQEMWPVINDVVGLIKKYSRKKGLVKTERSIHEFYRLENGYELWANCACCRGLRDASEIAKLLGYEKQSKDWKLMHDKLLTNIKNKLFDKKNGLFMKNPKYKEIPDISQLAPFYFEIIDNKMLLKKTLKYVEEHLTNKEIGGMRRFRRFEICKDWHWYTGGSGSWFPFTIWMAKFYKKIVNEKKYKEYMNWVKEVAKINGNKLPEHIAIEPEYHLWKDHEIEFNQRIINAMKKTESSMKKFRNEKIAFWANPLGWSHAEYIMLKSKK